MPLGARSFGISKLFGHNRAEADVNNSIVSVGSEHFHKNLNKDA